MRTDNNRSRNKKKPYHKEISAEQKLKKAAFDVVVVGAGAAGLFSAITAARRGNSVLILEKNNKIGKKLLATGNGKCNFTNEDMDVSHFFGDKEMVTQILGQFSKEDCLSFFLKLGILPKCKNGYYYPNSQAASSVVQALWLEVKRLGIELFYQAEIRSIQKKKMEFEIFFSSQEVYCRKLILAPGLLANPKLGSDGSLFDIIRGLGHRFTPIVPALCGLHCAGLAFKELTGIRCAARVSVWVEGNKEAEDTGELQLAEYGISGIPVFQISRIASLAVSENRFCQIHIDFLPELTDAEVLAELRRRKEQFSDRRTVEDFLNGLFPPKLIPVLIAQAGISRTLLSADLSQKQLEVLCRVICDTIVTVKKAREFEFAQVCAGGIRTEEIDKQTLESKLVDGLYFAGEILDVDAICGGYNLQWAWSSGYVAGCLQTEERRTL